VLPERRRGIERAVGDTETGHCLRELPHGGGDVIAAVAETDIAVTVIAEANIERAAVAGAEAEITGAEIVEAAVGVAAIEQARVDFGA